MDEGVPGLNLQIRRLRKEKGLTLAELAAQAGISITHMSELERGKKNLNNKHLASLAQALGVQPASLISPPNDPDLGNDFSDYEHPATSSASSEDEEFLDALEWWLEQRNDLTPTSLSRKAGMDKTSVRQMIINRASPRIDTVLKICKALDVSLGQFFARDQNQKLWPATPIVRTTDEKRLLKMFRRLTDGEKEEVLASIRNRYFDFD